MTTNELFHELFTTTAWEIYTSYLSELKALMEKYQIDDHQYSVVIKALVDHIKECMVNQQLEMVNEECIQGLFQDIGQSSELLYSLGFVIKCWNCLEIMDKNIPSCKTCGSISFYHIIDSKVLKQAPILILKNRILFHRPSKFILFILLAGMLGLALHEYYSPIIFVIGVIIVSSPFFLINNPVTASKYRRLMLFFKVYFLKGIALFYLAANFLVYEFYRPHPLLYLQEELIPVASLLAMASLWVLTASRDRLRFFHFIEEKKKLETRFKQIWQIEIRIIILLLLINLILLQFSLNPISQTINLLVIIDMIIRNTGFIILPLIDGLLHMWFLRYYLLDKKAKGNFLN